MNRIQRRKTWAIPIAWVMALGPWCATQALTFEETLEPQPVNATHTIYVDIVRHAMCIAGAEASLIGWSWEYRMGQSPVHLLSSFKLGYMKEEHSKMSYGLGLGLRRYLYQPTEGPFLQFNMDGGETKQDFSQRLRYGFASVEYGYKIVHEDFIFAVHGGTQYYGFSNSKSVQLILGIDLGFPLTLRSFRQP